MKGDNDDCDGERFLPGRSDSEKSDLLGLVWYTSWAQSAPAQRQLPGDDTEEKLDAVSSYHTDRYAFIRSHWINIQED